jgi:hypothetical protein
MLQEMDAPEEFLESFQRARKHHHQIASDPTRSREALALETQLLASYLLIAEETGSDDDDPFSAKIHALAAVAMKEAREMAEGIDTSDWSSSDFLFYRLYKKGRASFDSIDSPNAAVIRKYLDQKNEGRDPLHGEARFSDLDYREQGLLLHGACIVHEDPDLRALDQEMREKEEEIRQRAAVGGQIPDKILISLPRDEWSVLRSSVVPGAPNMIPEEPDHLLMDGEPGSMGFVSAMQESPAFILVGAIKSMNDEGHDYKPEEIATHELIHTLQPGGFMDQKEVTEELRSRGQEANRGASVSSSWREANTEMLRVIRENPGLAENLDRLHQIRFAYRQDVLALANILEKIPPEERLQYVDRFNQLGTLRSFQLLEGTLDDPLAHWQKHVLSRERRAAE